MFFILSKTIGILLLPSTVVSGVGIVGLILLLTRFRSLGRKMIVASVLLFACCGFLPAGSWLLYPLENRFPRYESARGAPDGIIVLGGSIEPEMSAARGVPVFGSSVDRIVTAAGLAHRYPDARVVFSGGSANLFAGDAVKEADFATMAFESFGIAKERMILERRSRNTLENAEFTKELLSPRSSDRWLLVTSAYHMPRSIGIFRRAGFAVEPWPADWRTGGPNDLWTPPPTLAIGLNRLDTAWREWVGLIAYRIAGYTSALFPGPMARP